MNNSLKLISLNIEGDKHLDLVRTFLEKESPDVICLQEVFEKDIKFLNEHLSMHPYYVPMININIENKFHINPRGNWGILILCKDIPIDVHFDHYVGEADKIPLFNEGDPNFVNRVLGSIKIKREDIITISTTHFTWSGKGETTELQRENFKSLLAILNTYPSTILCGDFNAPRGGEIYTQLSELYKDNIPSNIITTLDSTFHYAGKLDLVVDGLFTTDDYCAQNVEIKGNVSDHKAIVAIISKCSI